MLWWTEVSLSIVPSLRCHDLREFPWTDHLTEMELHFDHLSFLQILAMNSVISPISGLLDGA